MSNPSTKIFQVRGEPGKVKISIDRDHATEEAMQEARAAASSIYEKYSAHGVQLVEVVLEKLNG